VIPLTADERARTLIALGQQNPASADLVVAAAGDFRLSAASLHTLRDRRADRAFHGLPLIIRRLLDAEAEAATLRRVLAEAGALAYDQPDGGITAGDIKHLAAAVGIDIEPDIDAAAAIRMADATGGAW
jgi:hypothetical protein